MTHFTTPGGPNYVRMFREFGRWYRSWRKDLHNKLERRRLDQLSTTVAHPCSSDD